MVEAVGERPQVSLLRSSFVRTLVFFSIGTVVRKSARVELLASDTFPRKHLQEFGRLSPENHIQFSDKLQLGSQHSSRYISQTRCAMFAAIEAIDAGNSAGLFGLAGSGYHNPNNFQLCQQHEP